MRKKREKLAASLIQHIAKTINDKSENQLRKAGISRGQGFLLMALNVSDDISQKTLAINLQIKPPTLTKMLQKLEQKDLIVRYKDTDDDRITRLRITSKGRVLGEKALNILKTIEKEMVTDLDEKELSFLHKTLIKTRNNLGVPFPEEE